MRLSRSSENPSGPISVSSSIFGETGSGLVNAWFILVLLGFVAGSYITWLLIIIGIWLLTPRVKKSFGDIEAKKFIIRTILLVLSAIALGIALRQVAVYYVYAQDVNTTVRQLVLLLNPLHAQTFSFEQVFVVIGNFIQQCISSVMVYIFSVVAIAVVQKNGPESLRPIVQNYQKATQPFIDACKKTLQVFSKLTEGSVLWQQEWTALTSPGIPNQNDPKSMAILEEVWAKTEQLIATLPATPKPKIIHFQHGTTFVDSFAELGYSDSDLDSIDIAFTHPPTATINWRSYGVSISKTSDRGYSLKAVEYIGGGNERDVAQAEVAQILSDVVCVVQQPLSPGNTRPIQQAPERLY